MEAFYDGDLKDIWDSDLDPTESLKISTHDHDHDMSDDWFLERDVKESVVILNDRLISDALLNGTLPPIKTEHSYSLASDGDSLPDSPHSLQAKMDDIDDECYPAISLKTATNNLRSAMAANATIDPKCLTLHTPASAMHHSTAQLTLPALNSSSSSTAGLRGASNGLLLSNTTPTATAFGLTQQHNNNNTAYGRSTLNWRTMMEHAIEGNKSAINEHHQHQQQHSLPLLPQKHAAHASMYENDCSSSVSTREGSISPDICSDIEIDESCIKDEPLSPNSSCPASPKSQSSDMSAANATTTLCFTTPKLDEHDGFEQKNGLQLAAAHSSQSYLKTQQFLLGNAHNLLLPKINIKNEKQSANSIQVTTTATTTNLPLKNNNSNSSSYGIPLTPPPSLPSDESEGNLTPEHLFSPLSPNTSVSISVATLAANGTLNATATTTAGNEQQSRRSQNNSNSSSSSSHSNSSHNSNTATTSQGRNSGTSSTSTRQPIHTPLISSQPKGSTGTLLLTEEEKRTLLAEGYPIPQKLPLTKAEEKSLKKIRRKIKNKISAQESRRKKKEYMDQLERRVDILVNENIDYKKRLETLENTNANLLSQLQKLQALANKLNANNKKA